MNKAKILVTGIIPEAGLTELKENFEVVHAPEHETRKCVLAHLSEYEGLIGELLLRIALRAFWFLLLK